MNEMAGNFPKAEKETDILFQKVPIKMNPETHRKTLPN